MTQKTLMDADEVKISQAVAGDAGGVAALVDAAYGHYVARIGSKPGPMLDDYASVIAKHSVWVVRDAARIVGALVLIDKPKMLLLDNVVVHPKWQGRGIGKRLMQLAEEEAKQRGYEMIQLYTHELMIENIGIYERVGYEVFNRRIELGLKRVYMKKELDRR